MVIELLDAIDGKGLFTVPVTQEPQIARGGVNDHEYPVGVLFSQAKLVSVVVVRSPLLRGLITEIVHGHDIGRNPVFVGQGGHLLFPAGNL